MVYPPLSGLYQPLSVSKVLFCQLYQLYWSEGLSNLRDDAVLDQALQHLKLVLIEPGISAKQTPVDLDQMGAAVKAPEHGRTAFGAVKGGDNDLAPVELASGMVQLVLIHRGPCKRGHAVRAGARSCAGNDPGDPAVLDQRAGAETAAKYACSVVGRVDEGLSARGAGEVRQGLFLL